MSTEQTTENVEEKVKESLENSVEKVIEAQEVLAQAFDNATKRGLRVSEKFIDGMTGSQQCLITMYRDMAKAPTDYAKNTEALMTSFTGMQQRTLEFAKVVYKEQSESAEEMKEIFSPYLASSKKLSENTKSWMGMWAKPFQMNAS